MFDFEPTEEQQALIDTARRFARERIIPIAAACDRESRFPMDVFEEAHKPSASSTRPSPPSTAAPGLSDLEASAHHRGARLRLHAASRRA